MKVRDLILHEIMSVKAHHRGNWKSLPTFSRTVYKPSTFGRFLRISQGIYRTLLISNSSRGPNSKQCCLPQQQKNWSWHGAAKRVRSPAGGTGNSGLCRQDASPATDRAQTSSTASTFVLCTADHGTERLRRKPRRDQHNGAYQLAHFQAHAGVSCNPPARTS